MLCSWHCEPLRYLPPETQVVLVSATLPAEVLEMTNKFMTDPIRVLVKRDELTLEVSSRGDAYGIGDVYKVTGPAHAIVYAATLPVTAGTSHVLTPSHCYGTHRESSNSSWQWSGRSGSLTPCATCTTR